jgi:hypothetical protein
MTGGQYIFRPKQCIVDIRIHNEILGSNRIALVYSNPLNT